MSLAQSLLPEFDHEMADTRKVPARIPDDKFAWRAHPKSNTIGWVASLLAVVGSWAVGALTRVDWDVRPDGGEPYPRRC